MKGCPNKLTSQWAHNQAVTEDGLQEANLMPENHHHLASQHTAHPTTRAHAATATLPSTSALAAPTASLAARNATRFVAALLAATLVLFGNVRAQGTNQNGLPASGITVSGSGAAYGEPDRALVTLGVTAVNDNVRDALAQADETMNAVRQAVLELGIETNHIRTVSFNVWRQQLSDRDGQPTGERYHVQHSFQVTVDNTALVGQLLASAVDAGVNDVGGISFTISDTAALQTEARSAAMADARARASQLAQLAGVELGQVLFIEETSYNAPMALESAQYARAASMTPIEGGELAVSVTVKVVFGIMASE